MSSLIFIMEELNDVLLFGMFYKITKSGSKGFLHECLILWIYYHLIPGIETCFFIMSFTTHKLDKEGRHFHKHDISLTLLHDARIGFKT